MKRNFRKEAALFVLLCQLAAAPASQAALTDLANQPLANVGGLVSVKPNLMFLLDSSGSMMQQYTPDYVSERWGTPLSSDMHCRNSSDTQVWAAPGLVINDTNGFRDLCVLGDPPYMSPDFNRQYYSPDISYAPPIDYLGNSYPNLTSANTAVWTAVPTDGFNRQNIDQLENGAATVDISSRIPDRYWCTTTALATCISNTGDYSFPDATYKYNYNSGASRNSYNYVPPYYFRIAAGEYCTSDDLTNCQQVAKGAAAPGGYPVPAQVRWCNSAANAAAAAPPAGSCQGQKTGAFIYVRFTQYAATAPYGTIRIESSGSGDPVSISQVAVGAVVITNGAVNAPSGTNTAANRAALATALASSINTRVSAPDYSACAGAACLGPLGVTLANDTVGVYPAVPASPYPPMSVTAPSAGSQAAIGVITVGNSGGGGSKVTSVKVNGVEILNGGLANFGANSTANRTAAANAIATRINSYLNGAPWEYTAATNVPGTLCNASNKICVYAPVAAGALPNGYTFAISTSGGGGISVIQLSAMAGGVSHHIPTNVTAIGSTSTFSRTDLVPGATYPRASTRSDCITNAGYCTYEEEMTNYANWFAYYRTRMQAMKTAAGQAFLVLDSNYRVGFTTIYNTGFTANNANYVQISDFDSGQKQTWYNTFYTQNPGGNTPLRTALDRIGQLYSGLIAGPAANPVVQYSCQKNYTILTTDGYWNDSFSGVGNWDNGSQGGGENSNPQNAPFCSRSNGCYDGNLAGASNTLADVALKYYASDLRTANCNSGLAGADVCTNNVPTTTDDPNPAQHMVTFTLGLGVDGVMKYREDYATATSGDFFNIKSRATSCRWTAPGAVCNWPVPVGDTETAVDDLWHAAVNGHGKYFSAKDPALLRSGLESALTSLIVANGAAAAAATSTPNITQQDNDIFSSTFRTVKWDGEMVDQKIDPATGSVLPAHVWEAQALLDGRVNDSSDSRNLYMLDTSNTTLKSFSWGSMTAAEQAFFGNKCAGLSQCMLLDAAQQALANDGQKMVNYLRGQQELEVAGIYRDREHVLGDIADSRPSFVRNPQRSYGDTGYSDYKTAQASRQATVYVGANDGMLHAFNAATGQELWGYLPRAVLPNLYHLADSNYSSTHQFYADGSPITGDVYINGQWRTILVGGLRKGGRGYFALDVTDPLAPAVLWEICSDSSLCPNHDDDLGYSFGDAVITKRPSDGKWVVLVTSGYNNVSPGDGKGHLYVLDAATGAILSKIDNGAGSTSTPSGLARITGRALNAQTDNTSTVVFGGDLLGNLWRFDMSTNTVIDLGIVTDYQNNNQPITTAPEVGLCNNTEMVFVGTGEYLGISDLSNTQRQTIFGIKDSITPLGAVRGNNVVQQSLTTVTCPSGYQAPCYTASTNSVDLAAKNGWLLDLDQNAGERVNLDPQLFFGNLVVISNQPTSVSACSSGGNSYLYQLNYCTGSFLASAPGGVAGYRLFNSMAVGMVIVTLPSGGGVGIATPSNAAPPSSQNIFTSSSGKPRRVSWREFIQ